MTFCDVKTGQFGQFLVGVKMYGYTAEETVGRSIRMLAPPDRLDEIPQILERLKHGERIARLETIRRHKVGTLIHVSLTISPIRDASGATCIESVGKGAAGATAIVPGAHLEAG